MREERARYYAARLNLEPRYLSGTWLVEMADYDPETHRDTSIRLRTARECKQYLQWLRDMDETKHTK